MQKSCQLLQCVAKSRTEFYFVQRVEQQKQIVKQTLQTENKLALLHIGQIMRQVEILVLCFNLLVSDIKRDLRGDASPAE